MRNISKSKLGRASMISAIAALAFIALGANAEARDGHGSHWHAAPGHWWHGPVYGYRNYGWAPYYGYRNYGWAPYYAPPTYYAPPAFYGPPSLNFNIPLG
jgi:hypothetical protein